MSNSNRLAATIGFLVLACQSAPGSAAPVRPGPPLALCADEVVYGTAIVDPGMRAFSLRGTEYVFVASEDVSLDGLDGQQVRVEIAPDCSVRELRVIGSDDDAIL